LEVSIEAGTGGWDIGYGMSWVDGEILTTLVSVGERWSLGEDTGWTMVGGGVGVGVDHREIGNIFMYLLLGLGDFAKLFGMF
jgi:hypothetical protein